MTAPGVIADRIIAGQHDALDRNTMVTYLSPEVNIWELMAAADRVRRARFGNKVHLCSIVNAKQGGCTEDCGFCSQSKHFSTHIKPTPFLDNETMVAASAKAKSQGASALGLVTATRELADDGSALDKMVEGVRAVRDAGHTEAHASLGFLSEHALERLAEAGLTELNHNLETSRRYFGEIVTSHGYDERIDTIKRAKSLGLRTCCGGIMGMGETLEDRADLAMELRNLDVDEVPLNFLVSIDGTRLAETKKLEPLEPLEMLQIIAAYRLSLPRQNVFIAAGRMQLGQLMPLMFQAGASGMMVGDFLTTPNRGVDDDLLLIEQLGLEPMHCGTQRPELRGNELDRAEVRTGPAQASRVTLPVV